MKTYLISVAVAISLAAFGRPVQAQDFTGPRVEARIGWDQLRFDLDDVGVDGSNKESDLAWGVAVGYDVPLQRSLVAGVEAGVTFSDIDFAASDGTTTYGFHAKRDIELSGRLGARVGSAALLYGKLGYTNFRLGSESVAAETLSDLGSKNLDGLRLGAGLEVAVAPSAYLKSEYRHSNYEDGVSRNEILTGAGFRF